MTYSPDGKYLITVGNNEVIRKYTVASEDEPATIEQSQDGKTAVVASDEHFVVSAEDGTVTMFSMATNTFTKLLVRTSLPPRDLSMSPDGLLVAVASDETVVKVVNLEDNQKVMILRGQKNSAKHVAFHPSGNYLAISGVDGTIYIYSLSTEEPELVKKIDGIISALKEDSESSSKVAWHPDGRAFLAQTPTRELVVVDRTNWQKHRVFANGHNGDITDYAWSPNGAFLASAGTDGKLLIWESKTQTIISRCLSPKQVLKYLVLTILQMGLQKYPQSRMASYRKHHLLYDLTRSALYSPQPRTLRPRVAAKSIRPPCTPPQ